MATATNYTKEELIDLMTECSSSAEAMAHTFFGEHCYRPFGDVHDKIFSVLDDDTKKLALLVCPRGFGKTTLSGLVFPAKKALFREAHYIIYISCTATKAVNDVQTLAKELQDNELIRKVFGDLKGFRWREGSGEIELSSDIKIEAKGAGQQIRGIKFGKYRPDLIIIDDLEDPEEVRSEERRKELKKWFFSDMLNSINLDETRVLMLGTILHEDSLIQNIIDESKEVLDEMANEEDVLIHQFSENFHVTVIEACNDKLEATWPAYMTTEKIRAKYAAHKKRGLLSLFYKEFRNKLVPDEGATFKKELFRYYKEDWKSLQSIDNVVIVDPAKTTNLTSADSAIVGVGFDTSKNKIYFRDVVRGKMEPDKIYEQACMMADRLGTNLIGVEVTSLNLFITNPFRNYLAKKTRHYELIELKAQGKKEERIAAMSPFYYMGAIFHNDNPVVHGVIEEQLLIFPDGKLVDVIDALAYFIKMFDLGERLFTMEVVEDEPGKPRKTAEQLEEEEFAQLAIGDYDAPLKDWARC